MFKWLTNASSEIQAINSNVKVCSREKKSMSLNHAQVFRLGFLLFGLKHIFFR